MQNIQDRVIDIVSESSSHPREKLLPTSRLRADPDLDSLDSVEMLMDIEKEWNLAFSDEDMLKLTDVQSIVNLVEATLDKKK